MIDSTVALVEWKMVVFTDPVFLDSILESRLQHGIPRDFSDVFLALACPRARANTDVAKLPNLRCHAVLFHQRFACACNVSEERCSDFTRELLVELKRIVCRERNVQAGAVKVEKRIFAEIQKQRVVAERAHRNSDLREVEEILHHGRRFQRDAVIDRRRQQEPCHQMRNVSCLAAMRTKRERIFDRVNSRNRAKSLLRPRLARS